MFSNLSSVMLGLDPSIHRRGCGVDPRVKPEDDVGGGARLWNTTSTPLTHGAMKAGTIPPFSVNQM